VAETWLSPAFAPQFGRRIYQQLGLPLEVACCSDLARAEELNVARVFNSMIQRSPRQQRRSFVDGRTDFFAKQFLLEHNTAVMRSRLSIFVR